MIISAKTEMEGYERLKKVLNIASEYGLNINWEKCSFLKEEIKF